MKFNRGINSTSVSMVLHTQLMNRSLRQWALTVLNAKGTSLTMEQ